MPSKRVVVAVIAFELVGFRIADSNELAVFAVVIGIYHLNCLKRMEI